MDFDVLSVLATGFRHLLSADRYARLRRALRDWTFIDTNRLPVAYLSELLPSVRRAPAGVSAEVHHEYELPYGERLVMAAIVGTLAPRLIVEFGTFTGATTRLIANDAPPGATIHTVDLPDAAIDDPEVRGQVGRDVGDAPASVRIIQHRCFTRDFDITELRGRCDLVFIDASHEYPDVLQDSHRALEMVAPGGLIVWDDYQAAIPGVVQALNELARTVPLARVAHTRLVLHQAGGFPGLPVRNLYPWARA